MNPKITQGASRWSGVDGVAAGTRIDGGIGMDGGIGGTPVGLQR